MAAGQHCGICDGIKESTCHCAMDLPGPAVPPGDPGYPNKIVRPYIHAMPMAASAPSPQPVSLLHDAETSQRGSAARQHSEGSPVPSPDTGSWTTETEILKREVLQTAEGPEPSDADHETTPTKTQEGPEGTRAEEDAPRWTTGGVGGPPDADHLAHPPRKVNARETSGDPPGRWNHLATGAKAAAIATAALAVFGAGFALNHNSGNTAGSPTDHSPVTKPAALPTVTTTVTVRPSPTETPDGAKNADEDKKKGRKGKNKEAGPDRVTVTARVTPPPADPTPPKCVIDYDVVARSRSTYRVDIDIRYYGNGVVDGWRLKWKFPDSRTIVDMTDAEFGQNGSSVIVTNSEGNRLIEEDSPVDFRFNVVGGDPDAEPVDAFLNTFPCGVD